MNFQLVIKEGARSDITEAFQYYPAISSTLGDDFLDRLEQAFERITSAPQSYARVLEEIRQMRVQRFPYVVSYVVKEDRVFILAVLHGHRDPSEWQRRVK